MPTISCAGCAILPRCAANNRISLPVVCHALELLSIDTSGLDEMDLKILSVILDHYNGGPVGLNTIAVAVGEESHTIEEVYEPYLIMQGFLKRTPRGREMTARPTTLIKKRGKTIMMRIILFLLAFCPLTGTAQADIQGLWSQPSAPSTPSIKILVLHDLEGVTLEVKGKYSLSDPYTNKHISTRLVGKSQFIQAVSEGLKWGEEFPGVHQLEIIPTAPDTQILVNGVVYKGKVQIYDIGRSISVVNQPPPVEEYLSYLLPEQYPQALPDEVLAALAITARTNAAYHALNPKSKFWGVDARQAGYKGYIPVDLNSPVQKALRATRNMVLSQTGTYERIVTPFAVQWESAPSSTSPKAAASLISIAEAVEMAKQGAHAANILEKAFPRATIQLIHKN